MMCVIQQQQQQQPQQPQQHQITPQSPPAQPQLPIHSGVPQQPGSSNVGDPNLIRNQSCDLSMVKVENSYPIHPNDISVMGSYGKALPPFPVTYRLSQELNSAMLQSMPKGVAPPDDDDDDDCDDDDDDDDDDQNSILGDGVNVGSVDFNKASLLKKRKKQMVSEEKKDDKYWERRRKNNLAAKRSRDARRAKENQVAIRATFLERENKILAQELRKARAENHLLKERLCKYELIQ